MSTYTVSLIKSEFITPSIRRSDIQIRYDEVMARQGEIRVELMNTLNRTWPGFNDQFYYVRCWVFFQSEAHLVQVYELTTWKFNDTIPRDLQMSMDVISHVNTGRVEKEIVSPITIVSKYKVVFFLNFILNTSQSIIYYELLKLLVAYLASICK